jgi:hypothetical protein
MPCAAPCNRLPCNERCKKMLDCGHRCPGIYGESCPERYCQSCGLHLDARVDLVELKTYRDVDVSETPTVVLGCSHFFTAESLDGLAGLSEMHVIDESGAFVGLKEPSSSVSVPSCPDCKRPIRQFTTRRYNRIINRAVMDEISLKFLVNGEANLSELLPKIKVAGDILAKSRAELLVFLRSRSAYGFSPEPTTSRYHECNRLEESIAAFCREMGSENQPAKKLSDAVNQFQRRNTNAEALPTPQLRIDKQVILGGHLAQLQLRGLRLRDQFSVCTQQRPSASLRESVSILEEQAGKFLDDCHAFVLEATADILPRLAAQGIVAYGRVAKCLDCSSRSRGEGGGPWAKEAKRLLETASTICGMGIEGIEAIRVDVEETLRLFEEGRYEKVTAEEIAAIKTAIVSGPAGIATHSGHWYKCRNGHAVGSSPFSCCSSREFRLLTSHAFAVRRRRV